MNFKSIKFHSKLKNYKEEYSLYRNRVYQLMFFVLLIIFALFFRLYDLQVLNHTKLQKKSDDNRLSLVPLFPYRGRIFDRNGEVLADNQAHYSLSISIKLAKAKREKLIRELAEKLQFDYQKAIKLHHKQKRHSHKQQTVAFVILNDDQATRFAAIRFLYPEVHLDYQIIRIYPHNGVAAHLLGHIGLVNERDLNNPNLFAEPNHNVRISHVGKSGIEYSYDKQLRGKLGYKLIEVNANGQKERDISVVPAQDGIDLQLTIDTRLQKHIDRKIRNLKGSVILMDVSNGEILAMSSAPYYDNNMLVSGQDISELVNNEDKLFLNRSIQALYPPASLVKPFVALAGLHNNVLDVKKKFFAPAYYKIKDNKRRFHDWKPGGHGFINMDEAIAKSADVYFYDLGYRLGIDKMHSFLSQFAFGSKTGIDLPGELAGVLPNREWKYANNGEQWIHGETVITAIGQGYFLATPLQLVSAMAILANHGEVVTPSLVQSNTNYEKNNLSHRVKWYDENDWNKVRQAMYSVVKRHYGTAYKVMKDTPYSLAGKTGTAQVINLAQDPEKRKLQKENTEERFRDHSLFASFAPYKNPKIAIIVLIENGGNGSGIASRLAKNILDKYFQYY